MDLKAKNNENLNDNLVNELAKRSLFGWFVALIMFISLVASILYFTLKPIPLLGVDINGQVVGQVVFDEAKYRSKSTVLADVKKLVIKCLSISKATIYEDTEDCLAHFEPYYAELRVNRLLEDQSLNKIQLYGCINTEFNFDEDFTEVVKLTRKDETFKAHAKGAIFCLDEGVSKNNQSQNFYVELDGILFPRTTDKPYAIEINILKDL